MKCPHCLNSFHSAFNQTSLGITFEGHWFTQYQVCPECNRAIINISNRIPNGGQYDFLAYPKGTLRAPLPSEVNDQQVISDYTEAALVLGDSPKASAALSRRCLQYILREKSGIKKGDLISEIQEIIDKNVLPSEIAGNLDAIRNIGNFAAHPIKSTSTGEIVDVEVEEAEWNLDVLDQLIDFFYTRPAVAQKKRDELNEKLTAAGKPPLN